MTNNSAGEMVGMSANPHNASSDADFMIGEGRAQVAAHVTANPINGPFVTYQSGVEDDNGFLNTYKAGMIQGTGSASSGTGTFNVDIENDGGTISTTTNLGTSSYSADPTTGRWALPQSSGKYGADVFYFYDTNSAVALFGDGQTATDVQNLIGWMTPQTAPNSGTWAIGNLATSYLMYTVPTGNDNDDFDSGISTLNSSGALTALVLDSGGQNWADWDEFMCGSECAGDSGAFTPDTTLDPGGTLGVFDMNLTQSGTTTPVSDCVAISVDKATNSSSKGRLVCLGSAGQSPQLIIIQE